MHQKRIKTAPSVWKITQTKWLILISRTKFQTKSEQTEGTLNDAVLITYCMTLVDIPIDSVEVRAAIEEPIHRSRSVGASVYDIIHPVREVSHKSRRTIS